jgi:hypothetical protein
MIAEMYLPPPKELLHTQPPDARKLHDGTEGFFDEIHDLLTKGHNVFVILYTRERHPHNREVCPVFLSDPLP